MSNPNQESFEDQLRTIILGVCDWSASLVKQEFDDDPLEGIEPAAATMRILRLFQATTDQRVAEARKQAASDIFSLAHQYARDDKTMRGSESLRDYHYYNAISKIGEFDER